MSEEGDFVALLLAKLRSDPGGPSWPDNCDYDETTRTARLASIHLQERVATTWQDPLVIRYGVAR